MDKLGKTRRIKKTKKLLKKKKIFKIIKVDKNNKKFANSKRNFIKKSQNSLINISKEVFDLLKINRIQTGTQVTKHIENQIKNIGVEITFKNIQRRVYDAINVLSAIGLISKQKSSLIYNGEFKITDSKLIENIQSQKSKNNEFKSRINSKQNQLMMLCAKNYFTEKLIRDNSNPKQRRETEEKILFPFFLLKLENDSCYTIKQDDGGSRVCLFSDREFNIMSQEEILREILKNDKQIKEKLKSSLKTEINTYIHKNALLTKFLSANPNKNNLDTFPTHIYKKSFCSNFDSENEKNNIVFDYLDAQFRNNDSDDFLKKENSPYDFIKCEVDQDGNEDSTLFNSKFMLR